MVYTNDKLYCQNPQCGREIEGDLMSYSDKKVYHPGDCQNLVAAHEAMDIARVPSSASIIVMEFELLSRESALRFLREGELEQSIRREGFLERLIGFFKG